MDIKVGKEENSIFLSIVKWRLYYSITYRIFMGSFKLSH